MEIFKNITNFNESIEQPVVGEPADLIFAGGFCLFFGILGIVANVIGLAAIVSNRKLHTPCFLLISAELVTACLTAVGFLADGAQFSAAGAKVGISRSRLACFALGAPKTMAMAPSAVLTCTVAIDRLISVTWPMYYKRVGRHYAICSLSLCAVVAVVNTIAAAVTGPHMIDLIPCYNSFLALDVYFFIYYTCHNLFFCFVSVCVYATIIVIVKARKASICGHQNHPHSVNQSRPDSAKTISTINPNDDVFLRQQLALMPMIGVMVVLYLITGVVPEMATSISAFIDQGRYQPRVVVYASVLKSIGSSADVFILLLKCREFRNSLNRMVYRIMKRTMVEPVNEENVMQIARSA